MGKCDSCCPPPKEEAPVTSIKNPPQTENDSNQNNPPQGVKPNNISSSIYGFGKNSIRAETKINNNIISQSELLRIQKNYRNLFALMGSQKKTIGQGGQAKIRKFYSHKFNKTVVEKVIKVNKSTTNKEKLLEFINKMKNLIKEAMCLSKCNYPNVVKIYDFTADPLTIVMEYCDKGSLRSIIDQGFFLHPIYKIFLIYSICDGLGYIHTQGIIHGDLKCDNILLSTEKKFIIDDMFYPIPKLADFGLSQFKPNNIIAGTPGYIAPEIYKGSGLTKKTDIFALGMVMFEILSGLRPLPSNMDLALQCLEQNIPPCTKEVLRMAWDKRIEELLPGVNNAYYDAFYTLMILCIDDDPKKRPDIETLFLAVRKLYIILLEAAKEKVYDESEIIKRGRFTP
jgi:serine/threonine protein kinase